MIEALFLLLVFPLCMASAAASDLMSMRISNRLGLVLVACFAVAAPFTGMDWATYAMHFAAASAVLLCGIAVFAAGSMGAGDAKLLSATALFFGFNFHLIEYLVIASIIGGVLTLATLGLRNSPLRAIAAGNIFLRNLADPTKGIPYGVALAIAGLIVYPKTELVVRTMRQLAGG